MCKTKSWKLSQSFTEGLLQPVKNKTKHQQQQNNKNKTKTDKKTNKQKDLIVRPST